MEVINSGKSFGIVCAERKQPTHLHVVRLVSSHRLERTLINFSAHNSKWFFFGTSRWLQLFMNEGHRENSCTSARTNRKQTEIKFLFVSLDNNGKGNGEPKRISKFTAPAKNSARVAQQRVHRLQEDFECVSKMEGEIGKLFRMENVQHNRIKSEIFRFRPKCGYEFIGGFDGKKLAAFEFSQFIFGSVLCRIGLCVGSGEFIVRFYF